MKIVSYRLVINIINTQIHLMRVSFDCECSLPQPTRRNTGDECVPEKEWVKVM